MNDTPSDSPSAAQKSLSGEKTCLSVTEQIRAWKLWKSICSISGCAPAAPGIQERIKKQTLAPRTAERLYQYLRSQILAHFKNALEKRCKAILEKGAIIDKFDEFIPNCQEGQILYFDSAFLEYAQIKDKTAAGSLAHYKDFLWEKLTAFPDNELPQRISGKIKWLLIDRLIVNYLREHWDVLPAKNKRYYDLINIKSLDSPVLDREGQEEDKILLDTIPDSHNARSENEQLEEAEEKIRHLVREQLSERERKTLAMMILDSETDGGTIKIKSAKEIGEALGLQKTNTYELINGVKKKLWAALSHSELVLKVKLLKKLLYLEKNAEKDSP